jgi:pimeloyl-ACP methyl ester carboxylesterase
VSRAAETQTRARPAGPAAPAGSARPVPAFAWADEARPAAPERPPAWEEAAADWLFRAMAPPLAVVRQPAPPAWLAPWQSLAVPRRQGRGFLSATWFAAPAAAVPARGAVLLLHPWVKWGKAYFHRGGRLEALRAAGYHVLAPDLPGFGDSSAPAGFPDLDVAACIACLRRRAAALPLHLWGVSSGGYWAHPALSAGDSICGAFFEDVAPHLVDWSWRLAPRGRPVHLVFRTAMPRAYRFLALRRHAAALRLGAAAYVSGECDPGVLPEETRDLARRAGASHLVVPAAEHLGAIKRSPEAVIGLALETFDKAAARRRGMAPPSRRE